jgi:hypothetical protein
METALAMASSAPLRTPLVTGRSGIGATSGGDSVMDMTAFSGNARPRSRRIRLGGR